MGCIDKDQVVCYKNATGQTLTGQWNGGWFNRRELAMDEMLIGGIYH
jgi:hypothetical protein